jgi:hypothetical protein
MCRGSAGLQGNMVQLSVLYAVISLAVVNAASHPLSTQWLNTVHHHSAPHHRRHLLNCSKPEGCSQGSLTVLQPSPTLVPVKLPGVKLAMLHKGGEYLPTRHTGWTKILLNEG